MNQEKDFEILTHLEEKVNQAIETIASLRRLNKKLMEEQRQLQTLLEEKDSRIEGLQKKINELESLSDNELLARYKNNEKKLRSRIEAMLAKLDELRSME